MESKRKKYNCVIGLIIAVLLIVIGLLLFVELDKEDSSFGGTVSQDILNTIEYEGETYRYNSNLMNILFLGIDKDEALEEKDMPRDAGQSDCIMIMTLNKETKEASILQISRDTITEIDMYDASGNYYNSTERQIATQFAYGLGGKDSCWATKKTVSELLYDLPIDGYLAIDMAGIRLITDAIGGVTITIPEDYTYIDPSFEKGATITLDGGLAESYVRYRDTEKSFSNNERMERQLQFIPAFIDTIKSKVGENGNYFEMFYPLVEEYMVTDLREDQLNELAEYDLLLSESQTLPGENVEGEKHDEFYVDDEKLLKIIVETFYNLEE